MWKLIKKHIEKLPFLIFFFYVMWLLQDTVLVSDDLFYETDLQKYHSVLSWCKAFYMGWGGRVPVQLFEIFSLQMPIIAIRILIALSYTMVGVYISYITGVLNHNMTQRKKFALNVITCFLLSFIQINVTEGAVLWISGAFNYIIPILALLICISPFVKMLIGTQCRIPEYVAAALFTILAAYTEQTSAVLVCIAIVAVTYQSIRKRHVPKVLYGLTIFFLMNTLIQFLAPGNTARSNSEMLLWFKQFDMYNLWDKMAFGLIHIVKQLFENNFGIIVCLLGVVAILSIHQSILNKVLIGINTLISVLLRELSLKKIDDSVITDACNTIAYVYIFLIVVWILAMGVLIMDLFQWSERGIITALFGWASLCTGMVMGFSPTIFASGSRVFMICYIFLILEIVHMTSYINVTVESNKE